MQSSTIVSDLAASSSYGIKLPTCQCPAGPHALALAQALESSSKYAIRLAAKEKGRNKSDKRQSTKGRVQRRDDKQKEPSKPQRQQNAQKKQQQQQQKRR